MLPTVQRAGLCGSGRPCAVRALCRKEKRLTQFRTTQQSARPGQHYCRMSLPSNIVNARKSTTPGCPFRTQLMDARCHIRHTRACMSCVVKLHRQLTTRQNSKILYYYRAPTLIYTCTFIGCSGARYALSDTYATRAPTTGCGDIDSLIGGS